MSKCVGKIVCAECQAEFGEHRLRDSEFSAVKIQLLDLVEAAFNAYEALAQIPGVSVEAAKTLLELKEETDAAEFMLLSIARESAEREEKDV